MWQKLKNIYHLTNAFAATLIYSFPSRSLKIIGITGTDGKTTTAHMVHHILTTAGKKASLISSVYAQVGGVVYDTGFHVTTPDSWLIQKFFRKAVEQGDEYVVLEVTSHALDQNRVFGLSFEIGVLTNITHEHLDYHRSYRSYVKAKEKLLQLSTTAVINRDDASYAKLDKTKFKQIVTYGIKFKSDIMPQTFPFTLSVPGEYNRYNALAAIAATLSLGIDASVIRRSVSSFSGVRGRFEIIKPKTGPTVVIDFAHTPNAFAQVLPLAKALSEGRLIHVFGAAALRDKTKRPLMGAASAKYANIIVLTEEDYRTEDVNVIIDEIASGCREAGAVEKETSEYAKTLKIKSPVYFRIPDRQTAVDFALTKMACAEDIVLLTGKAHEKSLCRGKIEYPWSEHETVAKALDGKVGSKSV